MAKKAYQHLTHIQRCQISVLLKSNISQQEIAKLIGSSQSTISREIRRNSGLRGYRFKQAHHKAVSRRRKASSTPSKFSYEIQIFIEYLLTKKQWSPEQISGWMKRKYGAVAISHERIYQHVWQDKRKGGSLFKSLRQRGKKRNKRGSKAAGRGLIPNRVGIEERPDIVDDKQRVGDFEVDTIVGAQRRGSILSIVDRKTKLTFLALLPRGTASNVSAAMIAALKPIKEKVHTITADNGKEFAMHQKIAHKLNANFFFAQPYHSWERGLNENTNGLVRQYFPKKIPFDILTQRDVDRVEYLLNTRPRKTLNYKTPLEVFFEATGKNLDYALQG